MALIRKTTNDYRKAFYQTGKEYNKFKDIDKDRIQELRKNLEFMVPNEEASIKKLNGLAIYTRMLIALNNVSKLEYTFDDRAFLLIEACDPNLISFKTYLLKGKPEKGTPKYDEYKQALYTKLGFADENMRILEIAYNNRMIELKNESKEEIKALSRTKRK